MTFKGVLSSRWYIWEIMVGFRWGCNRRVRLRRFAGLHTFRVGQHVAFWACGIVSGVTMKYSITVRTHIFAG